jgi:hypothetical protein
MGRSDFAQIRDRSQGGGWVGEGEGPLARGVPSQALTSNPVGSSVGSSFKQLKQLQTAEAASNTSP